MSVDYYNCETCNNTFPDCSDYCRWCQCGAKFCCDECAGLFYGEQSEDEAESCCICRDEVCNDYILLNFLLVHYNISKEDATELWKKSVNKDGK